jgi:hypothetical protein
VCAALRKLLRRFVLLLFSCSSFHRYNSQEGCREFSNPLPFDRSKAKIKHARKRHLDPKANEWCTPSACPSESQLSSLLLLCALQFLHQTPPLPTPPFLLQSLTHSSADRAYLPHSCPAPALAPASPQSISLSTAQLPPSWKQSSAASPLCSNWTAPNARASGRKYGQQPPTIVNAHTRGIGS